MAKFKIFGREIIIGKDLSQYVGSDDDLWKMMTSKYGVDYSTKNKLKAYKGVVYGCVSLIGEELGDYEPYLEEKRGDKWYRVDHEFMNLLDQPSGRDLKAQSFTKFDLFEATGSYQQLQGGCFWYMALGKTTGLPREIVILRADKVGTDIDEKTGEVNGYFIRRVNGDPIPLDINEVLYFPLFNPESRYEGKSVVEAGNDYIVTDESTAAYTKNFFANNAGLSGVLNVKGEVTKGAFRKFVRAWRDKHEGVDNAGKVAILRDSDASFTKVGLGLDELDMANLRKMSLADVAMMFKVPLELLGKVTEGSGLGRGNIETLEYIFAKHNIDKKMKRLDGVIMFAMQRYYGLKPERYRVSHENVIPEDKVHILNERDKAVDRWQTRNEIRAQQEDGSNLPGGDQLFVPINNIPIDDAGGVVEAPPAKSAGIMVKITRTAKKKDKRQDAERFRLSLIRIQIKYARQLRKKLKPIFVAQRKEVLSNIQGLGKATNKDYNLFNETSYSKRIVTATVPVVTDLAEVQGGLAMVFAGDDTAEFLLTAPFKQILERGTEQMASTVNELTLEKLNTTLTEGVQAGEALGKLEARVNGVFDNLEGYRSEMIARTETLKSSNLATQWGYQQTGFVTGKQWVVNPDACPQCEEFEGRSVPLEDAFLEKGESYTYTDEDGKTQEAKNEYDTVETPPLHPNCRCTIVPVT